MDNISNNTAGANQDPGLISRVGQVKLKLKRAQFISTNSWLVTIDGQEKIVQSQRYGYYVADFRKAMESFNILELDEVEVTVCNDDNAGTYSYGDAKHHNLW